MFALGFQEAVKTEYVKDLGPVKTQRAGMRTLDTGALGLNPGTVWFPEHQPEQAPNIKIVAQSSPKALLVYGRNITKSHEKS